MIFVTYKDSRFVLESEPEDMFNLLKFGYSGEGAHSILVDIITGRVSHKDIDVVGGMDGRNINDTDIFVNLDDHTANFAGRKLNLLELPEKLNAYPFFIDNLEHYHSYLVEEQSKGRFLDNEDYRPDTLDGNSDSPPNLMGSRIKGSEKHYFILDIDYPVWLVPSSTTGHFHLFLDKKLSGKEYREALVGLWRAGIIADGNYNQLMKTGQQFFRLPGVSKGAPVSEPPPKNLSDDILLEF